LPLLLKKRSQKVGRQLDVGGDVLDIHGNIADGDVETHDLLHLELDGRLDLVNLLLHIFTTGKKGRELTGLGKTGTEKTGDLFDHVVGRQEEIITLGKLLHHLLVLVELLEILDTHVIDSDTISLFTMGGISQHAALETGTRHSGELEGPRETLVTDGIVVLQSDLNLNSFSEVTLLSLLVFTVDTNILSLGIGKDVLGGLIKDGSVKLGHGV